MSRVLLAQRTRVTLADQSAYRQTAAALAARFARRGQHVWVFRSAADPEVLLEFREGQDAAALAPADIAEAELQARLRELARYPREELWEEFPLGQET